MPRPKQTLSIEQINEFLEMTANESNEAVQAVRIFLQSELDRRRFAGNKGGRPASGIDEKELRRERNHRYNEKKKAKSNDPSPK